MFLSIVVVAAVVAVYKKLRKTRNDGKRIVEVEHLAGAIHFQEMCSCVVLLIGIGLIALYIPI